MKVRTIAIAAAALLCAVAAGAAEMRRFALIIGSSAGDRGMTELRYAAVDARSFSTVLLSFGALLEEDQVVLMNPDKGMISAAFAGLRTRLAEAERASARTELIFYYSGHADDEGLILARERYPWEELKAELVASSADVRLAILDSCSSGALTRDKGGERKAPFIVDTANVAEGYAYLTSSTAEEASQESDTIGSSFFSHALVSGLRGAADSNADGKVTLNEAYAYAYSETLARTEKDARQTQHPAFDIKLTGTGDLVLTDLRDRTSRLILASSVWGRISIRDMSGRLVIEVQKPEGKSLEIGLEPGTYSLSLAREAASYETEFTVRYLDAVELGDRALRTVLKPGRAQKGAVAVGPVSFHVLGVAFSDALDIGLFNVTSSSMRGLQYSYLANIQTAGDTGLQISFGLIPIDWSIYPLGGLSYTAGSVHIGQISTWANWAGGTMTGTQISLIGNVARGDVTGLQVALGVNVAAAETRGAQVSLLNVAARDVSIGQVGALNVAAQGGGVLQIGGASLSIEEVGAQINAFAGLSIRKPTWLQVSLFGVSYSGGDVRIGQFSGIGNMAAKKLTGAQIAAGYNYASEVAGCQVSLINIARDFVGAQVGAINIAVRGRGTQIGLINISPHLDGVPVGLLDIQGNGENHVDLFCDSYEAFTDIRALTMNLAFRFGSRWFHKYLGVVFSVAEEAMGAGQPLAAAEAGFGVRIPLLDNQVALMSDAGTELAIYSGDLRSIEREHIEDHLVPILRALVEVRPRRFPLGVIAGVRARVYIEGVNSASHVPGRELTIGLWGETIYVQPRFFVGLSL